MVMEPVGCMLLGAEPDGEHTCCGFILNSRTERFGGLEETSPKLGCNESSPSVFFSSESSFELVPTFVTISHEHL
jgi:hypothetical protein